MRNQEERQYQQGRAAGCRFFIDFRTPASTVLQLGGFIGFRRRGEAGRSGGISVTLEGFTRPCTGGDFGPCASSPGWELPLRRTRGTNSFWKKDKPGLSVAFDNPTLYGRDSDHALAVGEVGKTGVAVDTMADMERLFHGYPPGQSLDVHDHQRSGRLDLHHVPGQRGKSTGSLLTGSGEPFRTTF